MEVGSAVLALFLAASCDPPDGANASTTETTPVASATASAPASARSSAVDSHRGLMKAMQGRWLVKSSSGVAGGGAAFAPLVGSTVDIEDNALIVREPGGHDATGKPVVIESRKALRFLPGSAPVAIDLDHDSASKGWSRVGIVSVEEDRIRLCVNFPQGPRPARFEPNGTQELVELERRK